jgi:FMN phosphatase YigB (HAD superfamily)
LKTFPVFRCFDGHHFSHEVQSMKPAPAFYQAAIERFDLTPGATIYIDDLRENIATGRGFGFRCWQYRADDGHAACLRWLVGQGVPVSRGDRPVFP